MIIRLMFSSHVVVNLCSIPHIGLTRVQAAMSQLPELAGELARAAGSIGQPRLEQRAVVELVDVLVTPCHSRHTWPSTPVTSLHVAVRRGGGVQLAVGLWVGGGGSRRHSGSSIVIENVSSAGR